MPRPLPVALACLAGLGLAGCGGSGGSSVAGDRLTLLLDGRPRAVHAGIYLARARDFDGGEGVTLRVAAGRATRGAAAGLGGRADLAILELGDLMTARAAGHDVVGIMALSQRVPARTGPAAGDPAHPDLVVAATRPDLDSRRGDLAAVVRALQRGYEETIADPESAVAAMTEAVPGSDRLELAAELAAVAPRFEAGTGVVGRLQRAGLEAWARRAVESGRLERPPDLDRAFDFTLAGGSTRR